VESDEDKAVDRGRRRNGGGLRRAGDEAGAVRVRAASATLVTKDLVEGDGRTAIPLTSALVFYTGWVYDPCKPDHKGAQFDTNVGKRVPFGFRIGAGKVIKGWDEGLPGMKEGGKRLMIIPSAYGYGATEIPERSPRTRRSSSRWTWCSSRVRAAAAHEQQAPPK
jgi:FKBP-type peptidyl-prolyl cis-trans isomerase